MLKSGRSSSPYMAGFRLPSYYAPQENILSLLWYSLKFVLKTVPHHRAYREVNGASCTPCEETHLEVTSILTGNILYIRKGWRMHRLSCSANSSPTAVLQQLFWPGRYLEFHWRTGIIRILMIRLLSFIDNDNEWSRVRSFVSHAAARHWGHHSSSRALQETREGWIICNSMSIRRLSSRHGSVRCRSSHVQRAADNITICSQATYHAWLGGLSPYK